MRLSNFISAITLLVVVLIGLTLMGCSGSGGSTNRTKASLTWTTTPQDGDLAWERCVTYLGESITAQTDTQITATVTDDNGLTYGLIISRALNPKTGQYTISVISDGDDLYARQLVNYLQTGQSPDKILRE